MKKSTLIICIGILISGCSSTIDSIKNPDVIVKDNKGIRDQNIYSIATKADRKLSFINTFSEQVCAEPPADAISSTISSLAASLKADLKGEANVGANLAQTFQDLTKQEYQRLHSVQLFRDAAFHLCLENMNKEALSAKSYHYKDNEKADIFLDELNTKLIDTLGNNSIIELVKAIKPSLDKEIEAFYSAQKQKYEALKEVDFTNNDVILCNTEAKTSKLEADETNGLSSTINCQNINNQKSVDTASPS